MALFMSDESHGPTDLPDPASVNEHWDSYLALVDEAAASLLINMHFLERGPLLAAPFLHHWALPMRWPGPHGLGTAEEAEGFAAVEEQVTELLISRGFYPVGRLRTAGYWQVSYYAPSEQGQAMHDVLLEVMGEGVAARVHAQCASDPEWDYFLEFLCPDEQQLQWMTDRDVVMQLVEHGDSLAPRPVQHRLVAR